MWGIYEALNIVFMDVMGNFKMRLDLQESLKKSKDGDN